MIELHDTVSIDDIEPFINADDDGLYDDDEWYEPWEDEDLCRSCGCRLSAGFDCDNMYCVDADDWIIAELERDGSRDNDGYNNDVRWLTEPGAYECPSDAILERLREEEEYAQGLDASSSDEALDMDIQPVDGVTASGFDPLFMSDFDPDDVPF